PPFAPLWIEQVCLRLSLAVGTTVRCVNRSVGGMDAAWGRSAATGAFAGDVPDLFLIEFGMNDASGKTDRLVFRDNCRAIAEQLLALNPDVELLFVSTTLPNRMARDFVSDHETHEPLLAALADEFGPRADLVPMTSLHRYLLSKKSFWDMTGNNVNHPNDFLVRVYAQAILAVLGIEGGRA
ncbi:MAG: SGNH/GDSL hydrolase family protein, partial [Oscillospiraceae bacterium]|nr:SGNH/GDSL hydrolase family protein [Oscillospiraceae bacterium]